MQLESQGALQLKQGYASMVSAIPDEARFSHVSNHARSPSALLDKPSSIIGPNLDSIWTTASSVTVT